MGVGLVQLAERRHKPVTPTPQPHYPHLYHWREVPQVLFCLDKTRLLSQQKYIVCRDKICLSRQTQFCRAKIFVAWNLLLSRLTCVCRNKTPLLSRQKYACRDKTFVANIILSRQNAASILLSRQNMCLSRQGFVATKIILAAAPANDTPRAITRVVRGSYSGQSLRAKQTAFQEGVKS